MQAQKSIIVFSKMRTVITACAITLVIAATVSLVGKIDFHQFWMNILDWQICNQNINK